jgi:rRNA maturation RNase YbeY
MFTNFEIMQQQSKIYFFFESKKVDLRNRHQLRSFINSIFRKHKKKLTSLNYIFCSDQYLLEIKKTYLSHNYHTDIITFDLSENTQDIQAEIYISIDRVRDNAKTLKTTVKEELHRVIFHGVLHLCGYKDKTKSSQAEMRKAEDYYLQKYQRFCVPRETSA